MTSPADELRTAAERLRKLAEAATDGPWTSEVSPVYGFRVGTTDKRAWVAFTGDYADEPDESGPDADWIATMHPGVGEKLARWLEATVAEVTAAEGTEYALHTSGGMFAGWDAALAVARAINGSQP